MKAVTADHGLEAWPGRARLEAEGRLRSGTVSTRHSRRRQAVVFVPAEIRSAVGENE